MGTQSLRVRQYGERVHVITDGRLILDLPWEAALAVSQALRVKGKLAEADAKVQTIITDQAVLTSIGAPLGLSNNKKVLKESYKRAAELKYPQVEISSIVGTPAVHLFPPPKRDPDNA
jgi:hypothetical protein